MGIITELFVLFGIASLVYWWLSQFTKNNQYFQSIPGPPAIPILGHALDFTSTTEYLQTLFRYSKQYGGIFRLQIGPTRKVVVVSDYKILECILSSTKLLSKSTAYKFLYPWLGTGLLTSDGSKWKKHRRILTPAFHFQILEQFVEVFESCGEKLVEIFEKQVGKDSFDVYPFVTLCSLDIICGKSSFPELMHHVSNICVKESIMGTSVSAQSDANSDYVRSVKDMCRIVLERALSPIQMHDFLYPLTQNYSTQQEALKILHTQTINVIRSRRQELKSKDEGTKQEHSFTKNKKAFLDLLLQATIDEIPLTEEEIREQVDTFMFEGHDTTASAISFSIFCLANFPHVQQKAFEEQKFIFGDDRNPNVTYANLRNMKYLEQVIKETLRLYPSVPVYGRKTTEIVDFDNAVLPAGATILLFAYGIQRDSKYFEDPETFNPSRFENADGKLPYAFIPFSAGPRNCIGQKFALLEMKSVLSKILRKFELQPTNPQHVLKLSAEAVLKSANGIKIKLKCRR
ncbi:p450 domain containing protein [Asbolus verrucosus]|uniref:p450 domain containing protein n=1 Tax=Asbolus verrucosus TaxID=1661398 RepID=A0A482V7N8_ASBVE|nr:p450 domain containing protein [Asbolus verrucosus]